MTIITQHSHQAYGMLVVAREPREASRIQVCRVRLFAFAACLLMALIFIAQSLSLTGASFSLNRLASEKAVLASDVETLEVNLATVRSLAALRPQIESLGLVPVGSISHIGSDSVTVAYDGTTSSRE